MVPRRYAEKILREFEHLPPAARTSAAFLDLAEEIIHEAIAFELEWLAGYLKERAARVTVRTSATIHADTPLSANTPTLPPASSPAFPPAS